MVGRAVPKQVRAVSLMIWFLSKSSDLGMAYVLSRGQEYDLGDVDVYSRASVALFMVSWLADQSVRHSLHAGLASLDDQGRMVADQFLLHSTLMEFIVAQNRKGVALDLTSLIAKYIRLWTHRPIPNVIKRRLAKLVWHRGTRRRFRSIFAVSGGCVSTSSKTPAISRRPKSWRRSNTHVTTSTSLLLQHFCLHLFFFCLTRCVSCTTCHGTKQELIRSHRPKFMSRCWCFCGGPVSWWFTSRGIGSMCL